MEIWHTEPRAEDSDDDGFADRTDPRPNVEDNPPNVSEVQSDNYKDYIEFSVSDDSRVSVDAKPKYDPVGQDARWNSSKATVTEESDDEYRIEFKDPK